MATPEVGARWSMPFPEPPVRTRVTSEFTTRVPLAWTSGVALRAGEVTIGGSPWAVTRLPESVLPFARKLYAANRTGITASTPEEQDAAVYLLDRGIADPLPSSEAQAEKPSDVEIVVPVYGDPGPLERCLASLDAEGVPVIVVDDASPAPHAARIRQLAEKHGARLIVRTENGGPGAARTDGFKASTAPIVAFIDADAIASPKWVSRLRPIFEDPLVGAVGPRVLPDVKGTSDIELYEEARSELDMGADPSRVVFGVPAGWLPTASAIVRRSAVTEPPFDPTIRLGEDVDLFWRMHEAGWTVRYVTDVVNHHEVRTRIADFTSRRAGYGGSAADLEIRHPGRLTPASPSLAGLAVIATLSNKRGWVRLLALPIAGYELVRQRRMLGPDMPLSVAIEMTGRSLFSDAFWTGHLLRRDWWPVGWGVLALTPFSRLARGVAAAMAWEPVRDHLLRPTRLGPVKSLALRLLDDASYGTGVIRGAIRRGVPAVVLPRVRFPSWPRRTTSGGVSMQAGPQVADPQ
ncbi:mycofactocin biosynthesis glycosyltransferase MftF [Herbiconiux sp. L3-i23]|uniref:mycofactocin biosynthesis glycosyltransferase MftF n=1 Tax=Herbiconiux sp. L3-i23 TaxID=2905871 RepID=UPI00205FCBDD|nr:mycofactocin biosynthesis glycosyltransferase MftF [Herbiconiux sp. L3-i23]BDI22529.1 putative glycosyltransferase [Herbiconiux sp. L3-i23]